MTKEEKMHGLAHSFNFIRIRLSTPRCIL